MCSRQSHFTWWWSQRLSYFKRQTVSHTGEVYLDSRHASTWVDAVHSTAAPVNPARDVAAVHWLSVLFTDDQQRSQEEEDDWYQLGQRRVSHLDTEDFSCHSSSSGGAVINRAHVSASNLPSLSDSCRNQMISILKWVCLDTLKQSVKNRKPPQFSQKPHEKQTMIWK